MAVLHHPLSPVPSVEIAPYTGIVNTGQAKTLAMKTDEFVQAETTHWVKEFRETLAEIEGSAQTKK